jgi:hypothetical protein
MALFLASGIILITLLGTLVLFLFKYENSKVLLVMLLKLVIISLVAILFYIFAIFFKKPGIFDLLMFGFISMMGVVVCLRLFLIFREFVNFWWILTIVILIMINFAAFIFQIFVDNDHLALLSGAVALLIITNVHFLALSVLIKFQK